MTVWTRDDVMAMIAHDFPGEDPATVFDVLNEYSMPSDWGTARVQLAILRLSQGDIDRLLKFTVMATQDYRDVLMLSNMPITPDDGGT